MFFLLYEVDGQERWVGQHGGSAPFGTQHEARREAQRILGFAHVDGGVINIVKDVEAVRAPWRAR